METQIQAYDNAMEELCRRTPLSEFIREVKQMTWSRANRLYGILVGKVDEIDRQLRQRVGNNAEWERKSLIARSFMEQKRDFVMSHIDRMRAYSFNGLMARLGDNGRNIANNRLMMIQFLVYIIRFYIPEGHMKDEDMALVDTICEVYLSGDYQALLDAPFAYDNRGNKVISNSGRDIAFICPNEVYQEEYGMLFSMSTQMLLSLRKSAALLSELADDYESNRKVHNSISCIIRDIGSIVQEFP